MFYGNNHDFLQICTGKSDETENGKKRLFGEMEERDVQGNSEKEKCNYG